MLHYNYLYGGIRGDYMIKDGNYVFSDYKGYKDKFVNLFARFYGEEYRDIIQHRLDHATYVPYYSLDFISAYYIDLLYRYRDDLIKSFSQVSGLKKVTPEMADFILSEDRESRLYTGLVEGESLEKYYGYFQDSGREEMLKCREDGYKLFGLENDPDKFAKLQFYGKCYLKARKMVEDMHPCDVFSDMRRVTINEDLMLKHFLNQIDHKLIPLTARDRAIIHGENFDVLDVETLDCKNMLFHIDLRNPGYINAFTTESVKTIENSRADIKTRIDLLKRRVKYYVMKHGSTDILKCVTPEELFGRVEVANEIDFINRLVYESEGLSATMGGLEIDCKICDEIERLRKEYYDLTQYGCKYNQNIIKQYNGEYHDPTQHSYITHMYNIRRDPNRIRSDIFMLEDEVYAPKALNANFIHELGHVLTNHEYVVNVKGNRATKRMGIRTSMAGLTPSGKLDQKYYDEIVSMDLEENVNERLKVELEKLWEEMYPGDYMFKESDFILPDREDEMFVFYSFWNFLCDDFYTYFKENIKRHRIDPDYDMFFQHADLPATVLEAIRCYIKDSSKKHKKPLDFSPTGVVDYRLVRKLGRVVNEYRNVVSGALEDCDFPVEKVIDIGSEEFKKLPAYAQEKSIQLYREANMIFFDMLQDLELLGRKPMDDIERFERERASKMADNKGSTSARVIEQVKKSTASKNSKKANSIDKISKVVESAKKVGSKIKNPIDDLIREVKGRNEDVNSNDEGM